MVELAAADRVADLPVRESSVRSQAIFAAIDPDGEVEIQEPGFADTASASKHHHLR